MTTMVKTRIRRDDEVVVIAGRDKGARGKVIKVLRADGSVLVSKVNMIKRHTRQTEHSSGGIIEKEAPLNISNVQYFCASAKPAYVSASRRWKMIARCAPAVHAAKCWIARR